MRKIGLFLSICAIVSIVSATQILAQSISWQQLNGPFGGTALSFASNSNGDIFAGADQDQRGIFRSIDSGLTWQPKSAGLYLENRAFSWLVVDDSSYIIAGTNSHIGAKVYKSKDNGESWTEISNLGGTSVAVNDSGHIYVGNTGYAQYSVSKDGGYTWMHYSHPSPSINCVVLNDSGHIFIGGNYTGYRSTDNGANWTTLSLPDGINSIAVAPNGNLFAGCSRENASNSGVYRSTDNGDSWTAVKEGFRVYASHNIVVNDNGDIIVGTWGLGIWKSTDNGNTWNQKNSGLGHFYIKSMHISNNGDVYAGLSSGGIYRSTDEGEIWQHVGLTVAGVKALAISPSNGFLFASTVGMSRSTDSGVTWEIINNGIAARDVESSEIKNIAIKPDGTIFIGFTTNWPTTFVYRSTDNGDFWVRVDNFPTGININGLAVGLNGEIIATASGYHNLCQKSTDDGSTWQDIKYGQEIGGGKVTFNSAGDLFSVGDGIWRLSNNDSVWVQLSNGGYWTFYCGSNDYLYTEANRSTDNGLTWTSMPIGNAAYSYAENSLGHLFAGTFNFGSGVKRSTDYGETWESINSGIPTNDVRSVAVDADDYLYAGPWGYSLFKTITSTVTSVKDEKYNPTSFYLEQNYPNPFNPSTTIHFELPKESHIILKLYDLLGREVATLINEQRTAGRYDFELRTSSASGGFEITSGVYFYRLVTDVYTSTKKLILIK